MLRVNANRRYEMGKSTFLIATAALIAAGSALAASPSITWSGDRTLTTHFRLDDGMTGKPGYRRAVWTSRQPLRALLRVRTSTGKLVESEGVAGPTYSLTEALTWTTSKPGVYRVTLTLTSPTNATATAAWTATLTANAKKACVPTVRSGVYIGCG
jgi:hypothetical protein